MDAGRLVISGGGDRSLIAPSGGLEHEFTNEGKAGLRCIADGDLEAQAEVRFDSSLGSWILVHKKVVQAIDEDVCAFIQLVSNKITEHLKS